MSDSSSLESVSVVIAAYNAGGFILHTLESILDQTRPPMQIIVVDDGSTDNTIPVIRSYGQRIDLISEAHSGASAARNAGIRAARGRFIAFCDADDLWRRTKLEEQLSLALAHDYAWVVCDADWIDYDGESVEISMPPLREGDVLESLFLGNFIKSPTPIVRRDVFEEVGDFDETVEARIGEDWDMWLRIAARYPLGSVHEKLASVRVHPHSLMAQSTDVERLQGLLGVVERAVTREPKRLRALKTRAIWQIWRAEGVRSFRERRYAEADRQFQEVLHYRPANLEALAYIVVCRFGPGAVQVASRLRKHLW